MFGVATAEELKVGDLAPDFSLPGSDGKTYRLSDYRGKQAVVLAWFPRAFTPGCTTECKLMAQHGAKLKDFDVAYFTASVDTPEKNKEFAQSVGADYPILSDHGGEVAREYGVTGAGAALGEPLDFLHRQGRPHPVHRQGRPSGDPCRRRGGETRRTGRGEAEVIAQPISSLPIPYHPHLGERGLFVGALRRVGQTFLSARCAIRPCGRQECLPHC